MDEAFALAGAPFRAPRLPWDACMRIAQMARAPELWRACDVCGTPLLVRTFRRPFCSALPTTWRFDGRAWLLTDRGAVHATWASDRRGGEVAGAQAKAGDERVLRLSGSGGVAVPAGTPDVVDVDGVRFQNAVRDIRQKEWFRVVDGVARCYPCDQVKRRARRCFRSWRTTYDS